jgi:hypothetical protein
MRFEKRCWDFWKEQHGEGQKILVLNFLVSLKGKCTLARCSIINLKFRIPAPRT